MLNANLRILLNLPHQKRDAIPDQPESATGLKNGNDCTPISPAKNV